MIDTPGHWLEDDDGPYAHLREASIPVDIGVNQDFTQRIVDAVQGYKHPMDGLMKIGDVRLPGVAKACKIIGPPTSPSTEFQNASDKARTRMLERDANESFTLSNAAEISSLILVREADSSNFSWSSDHHWDRIAIAFPKSGILRSSSQPFEQHRRDMLMQLARA